MSSKTKIVVFHLKELVYTAIFVVLGLFLILLLLFMFLPGGSGGNESKNDTSDSDTTDESGDSLTTSSQATYIPGVYSSCVALGSSTMDVVVTLDSDHINAISLKQMDEATEAMYPLVEPALDSITEQVLTRQSTVDIAYPEEYQYTSTLLMEAIENTLAKAVVSE